MCLGIALRSKELFIVDIRFKQKNLNLSKYLSKNSDILSLTPYSNYMLSEEGKSFITFHNLISIQDFHKKVFAQYSRFEDFFKNFSNFSFLFRDFAFLITYEEYIKVLNKYIKNLKKENIKIIYISDIENNKNNFLEANYFANNDLVDELILVSNRDKNFYKKNNYINKYSKIRYTKSLFSKVISKYILKNKLSLPYDMSNFNNLFNEIKPIAINNKFDEDEINKLIVKTDSIINDTFFYEEYKSIVEIFKTKFKNTNKTSTKFKVFLFLSNHSKYIELLSNRANNIPNIFVQHGSYLQENIFLKYNEIYPADINLVLNDFTKDLFEKRAAKQVYSIGSINFNYSIIQQKNEYDFLYIIYCTSYSYAGTHIFYKESSISADASDIYERHKIIIELFGTKFKDKNICIKIQPGIMTGTMLYIPFLELSKNYPNVTIEFSVPIQKLVPKSKYIISDYFSSEFINRELHYKRDIILFNAAPLILPEETVDDMQKMFILVKTVEDLEEKIKNIEEITKDRPRYDDIIEYYSSKKCDTRKIVMEILKNNINKEERI